MSTTPPDTVPSPFSFTLPSREAVPRLPVGEVKRKAYWPLRVAFEAIPETSMVAVADLALSVTEVAITIIAAVKCNRSGRRVARGDAIAGRFRIEIAASERRSATPRDSGGIVRNSGTKVHCLALLNRWRREHIEEHLWSRRSDRDDRAGTLRIVRKGSG